MNGFREKLKYLDLEPNIFPFTTFLGIIRIFLKEWARSLSCVYCPFTQWKKVLKKQWANSEKCWFWIIKWPISPILNKIRIFLKNRKLRSLCTFTSFWAWQEFLTLKKKKTPLLSCVYWTLTSCRKSKKINAPIMRKRIERTNGWTWIHRTLR